MEPDTELVSYDPDSLEGLRQILAVLDEIRPQYDSRRTWALADRRVRALAAAVGCNLPITAAFKNNFDELKHPRGPDGRFIEVFSWVRWFDFDEHKWLRGKIMDIADDGEVTVHRRLNNDEVGVYRFTSEQARRQLYSQPKPKATIDFPDVTHDGDDKGWRHIGSVGGSNPGGTYQLDTQGGVQDHQWTEDELNFLFAGRPSVDVVGFVDDQEQFDSPDYSEKLKGKLDEKYAPDGGEVTSWADIPTGQRSRGGVIVWHGEDGPEVAVVNRPDERYQHPTPAESGRADYALQDWIFRKVKAYFLPQNPENKMHPTWRRVIWGIGPDTGMGVGGPSGLPSGFSLPNLPNLGHEAQGIAQSASQGIQTAAEIRNAATGALVSLEDIVSADPLARLYPFEVDTNVLGQGDQLEGLISNFIDGAVRPGDKFYIKDLSLNHTGPDWVANEVTANRLYELAGVAVPDVFQGSDPAQIGSRIIGGDLTEVGQHLNDPEVMARVRAGFTVDAWLANWDVAGLTFDNIVVDEDGIPYRIDAGGALAYRGMGSPKGDMFTPDVGELFTMGPDSPYGSTASQMFEGLTHEEQVDGARRVAGISPQQIRDLGAETGVDSHVVDTLIARRADIIDKLLGGEDPYAQTGEGHVPQVMTEPDVSITQVAEPPSNLDLIEKARQQEPDLETFQNPALGQVMQAPVEPNAPAAPATSPNAVVPQAQEFPPAVTWNDAWSWSGESGQWVTSDQVQDPPSANELEARWFDRVDELNQAADGLEGQGVISTVMPAQDLLDSGALDNPRAVILMTDSMAVDGGRTDMFVPWGTDANGNTVLVSRISAQTVTPAIDWADTRARVRALDLRSLSEADINPTLDNLDQLATAAADAQVSLEAVRTDYPKLADAPFLGTVRLQDLGTDPVDTFILDGKRPVTAVRTAEDGLQIMDVGTGETLFNVQPDALASLGAPTDFFHKMAIVDSTTPAPGAPVTTDPAGTEHTLVLPDMTGQQVIQAKLGMELLQQRSSLADAATVSASFPQDTWVKPDPEIDVPDVSLDVRGSKPVPSGDLAGPQLPDNWDYQADLPAGSFIDTSELTVLPATEAGPVHPGLPNTVPVIATIDFEAATDSLVDQWVMSDVQDYRFTRQPVRVAQVLRDDSGIVGISVVYPDGHKGLLQGPPQSRLHVVEPPKEAKNIPGLDSEIILGHNGDIRIGVEIVGSWWHSDRNISHRHTYGYMVEGGYTAHGKATIGFRTHAREVRKQVRSEVWFADNYEPVEPDSVPKTPGAKTLETQLKTAIPDGRLGSGIAWESGQAVNKRKSWNKVDSQGVIIGGVHPDRPDLVYYQDHYTGHITLENASDLYAHGEEAEIPDSTGGLFTLDGEQWYIQQVAGHDVVAYSVVDGTQSVFDIADVTMDQPSEGAPISTYEGKFLDGALSTPDARDEWQTVGGMLLADGEIPLPGTQVVDGSGRGWRVLRADPDQLVVASGAEIQQRPASEFRIDRAHYGGELGAIGQLEMRTANGPSVDFQPGLGDVIYTSPGQFHVLTSVGELHTFDAQDGWADIVMNTTEHGDAIQNLIGDPATHRVGVVLGGDTSVALVNQDGNIVSSSLTGSLEDAKAGLLTKDGSSRVVAYTPNGIQTLVDPAGDKSGVTVPKGASVSADYKPILVVTPEDMEWFPAPAGSRGPSPEAPPVPAITGGGLPEGTWDAKTFAGSDNARALADAVQEAWANAEFDSEGKTTLMVQFDQGAVEDFYVQVMPVRDKNTGQEYTEFFFRPLEDHAGTLYNTLIAPPPDETIGKWAVPDIESDVPPNELLIGQVIAVRRGPNGLLTGWGGEGDFGTARVISPAREIGTGDSGNAMYEFDVMLPNGKAATIVQPNEWHYYHPAEWVVTAPGGEELAPRKPGDRAPLKLADSARDAGWRMIQPGLGSQVPHEGIQLEGDGVKVINTDGAFDADKYAERRNEWGEGGTFARILGDGTKIWASLATPKTGIDHEENNFGRQIYIQVPRSQGSDEMARSISAAMEAVGISPEQQALPTNESLSAWALNTIGQAFGTNPDFTPNGRSEIGPLQPGRKWTQSQVEDLLTNEVGPRIGRDVTLNDFEFVVDPDGRLMVTTSQDLAEHISAQSGFISHRHESGNIWTTPDEGADRLGAEIYRALGGGKTPDNTGPAGRAATGMWAGGQSSDTDMFNGTGNRYYFWTQDQDPPDVYEGRGFSILLDDEIFQRFLGNGMSTRDNYGLRTSNDGGGFPLLPWSKTPGESYHNEATIKYGLDGDLIEAITVPDETYDGILSRLHERGMDQVAGRPIEEIIQPASQLVSMRERRKARLARPNAGFYPVVGNVAQVLAGETSPSTQAPVGAPVSPAEAPLPQAPTPETVPVPEIIPSVPTAAPEPVAP